MKILKFKSKNGEPVPIYIKTFKGKHIYKTPFQLPEELGKYIQDFIRPTTSTYLRFGKELYERLHVITLATKKKTQLSPDDKAYILKQMKYIMSKYENIVASRLNSKTQKKWLEIRYSEHYSKGTIKLAMINVSKELGIVYGIDLGKHAPLII
jgi:hypothetical protein